MTKGIDAWIKPSSGYMPEIDDEVLTFGTWGIQQGALTHPKNEWNEKFWALCGGDLLALLDQVTHWMPLPDPPNP